MGSKKKTTGSSSKRSKKRRGRNLDADNYVGTASHEIAAARHSAGPRKSPGVGACAAAGISIGVVELAVTKNPKKSAIDGAKTYAACMVGSYIE